MEIHFLKLKQTNKQNRNRIIEQNNQHQSGGQSYSYHTVDSFSIKERPKNFCYSVQKSFINKKKQHKVLFINLQLHVNDVEHPQKSTPTFFPAQKTQTQLEYMASSVIPQCILAALVLLAALIKLFTTIAVLNSHGRKLPEGSHYS